MVLKVVNEPLPRLTVGLPGDLEVIVYRCLEKDPARRFQNTVELAEALGQYAQSEVQAAISVLRTKGIVGSQTFPSALKSGRRPRRGPSTLSGAAGTRTSSSPHGRRWTVLAVMGVLIGVIVIAITAAHDNGKVEDPSPSARLMAHRRPCQQQLRTRLGNHSP